jgi:integrase/recombinase XerD
MFDLSQLPGRTGTEWQRDKKEIGKEYQILTVDEQEDIIKRFENFLRYERNYMDLTVKEYLRSLKKFLRFLEEDSLSAKNLMNIENEDLSKFLTYLKNKPCTNTTIAHQVAALRIFYTWIAYRSNDDKFFKINFFLRTIIRMRKEHTIPFVPTPEEIEQLRNTLRLSKEVESWDRNSYTYKKTVAAYAIFELLATSGLRSKELRGLRKEDVDLERRTMIIKHGKGNFQRPAVFGESVCEILKEHIELNNLGAKDQLFKLACGNALHYLVKYWAKRAKINPQIHAHSFRHYFITQSLMDGVSLPVVGEQVGHRDPKSTKIYTHFNINFIKQKYDEVNNMKVAGAEKDLG